MRNIYLSILGIIAGELMMFIGQVYVGLAIHIINLQAISLTLIFRDDAKENKNILQSFILLLLIRMIHLAMPQIFTMTLLSYTLVYGIMFLPLYTIINNQSISSRDVGINFKKLYIYLPAALSIGTAMSIIEYRILHPAALIEDLGFSNILLITMVMFVFVGAVEELIFRSILQTRLEQVFGLNMGLLLSAVLYGMMHASYGIHTEVLFATFFGIVLGFIFQKTRSFPFILIVHGTANVLLFGVLPIVYA
jgi:hypothetical protein